MDCDDEYNDTEISAKFHSISNLDYNRILNNFLENMGTNQRMGFRLPKFVYGADVQIVKNYSDNGT